MIMLLVSCQSIDGIGPESKRSAPACGVNNPVEDLPWLKELIKKSNKDPESPYCVLQSVQQGTYEGQTIYVPVVSGALCCTCAGVAAYNCQGDLLFSCNVDASSKITNIKTIWTLK
ncbi:hypothetical protein QNI22_17620 [Cytophagaceae bacterium BD1B2-1]|uniref:Uncharacterized protein n=2 Tax=Xanthocytophaga agilis TaxID=3048010 RepID=A0AAE3R2I0_9BACT|nr:hypothetical protein [Xanthocytophaga agilis]